MTIDIWMVWIIVAIVLFIVELVTPGTFYFFCIGVAAVVASVVSVLTSQIIAWVVFFVMSITLILLTRPIIKKLNQEKTRESNVDELVGQTAKVTQFIDGEKKPGMVKVKGEVWLAKSKDKFIIEEDVSILKVEGNYLIVEKHKKD